MHVAFVNIARLSRINWCNTVRNDLLCASVSVHWHCQWTGTDVQEVPFSDGSRREQVGITTNLGAGAGATLVRFYLTL